MSAAPPPADRYRDGSLLHRLPRELRDHIYGHLFGSLRPETTLCLHERPADPPLAQTCRLVRREVLPLVYRRVVVDFDRASGPARAWTLKGWLAAAGGAAKLALARELVLVVDEETGYCDVPLPPRRYKDSPWRGSLVDVLSVFFGGGGGEVGEGNRAGDAMPPVLWRPSARLDKVEVHVRGKKKSQHGFDGIGDSGANCRWETDECHFADAADVYDGFATDLLAWFGAAPRATPLELHGIFPQSWVLECARLSIGVARNFDGLLAECALFKIWAPREDVVALERLRARQAAFGGEQPTLEWESALRDVHQRLESAWKGKVVESLTNLPDNFDQYSLG